MVAGSVAAAHENKILIELDWCCYIKLLSLFRFAFIVQVAIRIGAAAAVVVAAFLIIIVIMSLDKFIYIYA